MNRVAARAPQQWGGRKLPQIIPRFRVTRQFFSVMKNILARKQNNTLNMR